MQNDNGIFARPKVICLTPVRNESWILAKFLAAASLWADHIIVADQHSEDDTREIARTFEKVILIENASREFNETERQRLLIDAARKIAGPRLLITLDADEFLTANFHSSSEWEYVKRAPPGTVLRFKWVNLRPDFMTCWTPQFCFPWGFMDDGSEHIGSVIHSTRIPMPANPLKVDLEEVKVLHYQYTDWERMASKHRWYQCWEVLNRPQKSALDIFLEYHHMYEVRHEELNEVKPEWFDHYLANKIDMKTVRYEGFYWWDREVLKYFRSHGTRLFRKLDIWDVDWGKIAIHFQLNADAAPSDPRNVINKLILTWLRSRPYVRPNLLNRIMLKLLRILRW